MFHSRFTLNWNVPTMTKIFISLKHSFGKERWSIGDRDVGHASDAQGTSVVPLLKTLSVCLARLKQKTSTEIRDAEEINSIVLKDQTY